MKKLSAMRLPTALVAVVLAVNGCANMDDKTTSAGIGAAVGCAAGAALAKLTKNDAGTACLAGAVVGGLLVGVLEAMGAGYLSSAYKDAIPFALILFILFFMPRGLFGAKVTDRV